jgi:hypothetical protein
MKFFRIRVEHISNTFGATQKALIHLEELAENENATNLNRRTVELSRDDFFKWRDSVRWKFGQNFAENNDSQIFQESCFVNAISTSSFTNLLPEDDQWDEII